MASRGAAVTLTSKAHLAVSEYEDDNIGVQAVQETTKAVESTVYTVDHAVYSHKLKAYDKAEKLVEKSDKANVNALSAAGLWRTSTRDTSVPIEGAALPFGKTIVTLRVSARA